MADASQEALRQALLRLQKLRSEAPRTAEDWAARSLVSQAFHRTSGAQREMFGAALDRFNAGALSRTSEAHARRPVSLQGMGGGSGVAGGMRQSHGQRFLRPPRLGPRMLGRRH